MNNFPFGFQELAKKDFFTALGLWIALEIVSFVLFPTMGLIRPGNRMTFWLTASLPLGIGGAFLIGASSRFIAEVAEGVPKSPKKFVLTWLSQFGGWLGLAGVMFPFFMVNIEYLTEVFLKIGEIPNVVK